MSTLQRSSTQIIKTLIILIIYSTVCAAEIDTQKTDSTNRPNDLRLRTSYMLINHDLDSSGFKNSNTSKLGSGYEFSYSKPTDKGLFRVISSSLDSEFDTASGLSPRKIKAHLNRTSVDLKPLDKNWGIGLEYRERKSENTTPNQMLPKTQKLSIRPFYANTYQLDESLKVDVEAGILIPLSQYERGEKTGSIVWVLAPDVEAMLVYKVNHFIDAAFGFELMYDMSSYSGSGSRGTSQAKETFVQTHIPFELRFRF